MRFKLLRLNRCWKYFRSISYNSHKLEFSEPLLRCIDDIKWMEQEKLLLKNPDIFIIALGHIYVVFYSPPSVCIDTITRIPPSPDCIPSTLIAPNRTFFLNRVSLFSNTDTYMFFYQDWYIPSFFRISIRNPPSLHLTQ